MQKKEKSKNSEKKGKEKKKRDWLKLKNAKIEKALLLVSLGIRIAIVIALISSVIKENWPTCFLSSLSLVLTFVPAIMKKNYNIFLPTEFELTFVFFIYSSLVLGLVKDYYTKYWWWDIALHSSSGLALGFLGFIILYLLYYENKIKTSPLLASIFAFSFALAAGAIWEIFEFAIDNIFGTNMQLSSLTDTMFDLINDALGALFVCFFGYMHLKSGKPRLISWLIKRFYDSNPGLKH